MKRERKKKRIINRINKPKRKKVKIIATAFLPERRDGAIKRKKPTSL